MRPTWLQLYKRQQPLQTGQLRVNSKPLRAAQGAAAADHAATRRDCCSAAAACQASRLPILLLSCGAATAALLPLPSLAPLGMCISDPIISSQLSRLTSPRALPSTSCASLLSKKARLRTETCPCAQQEQVWPFGESPSRRPTQDFTGARCNAYVHDSGHVALSSKHSQLAVIVNLKLLLAARCRVCDVELHHKTWRRSVAFVYVLERSSAPAAGHSIVRPSLWLHAPASQAAIAPSCWANPRSRRLRCLRCSEGA